MYYGKQDTLEYDLKVAPGADPKAIKLDFSGAESLALNAQGDLVLNSQGNTLVMHKPLIYQTIGGKKKEIEGNYTLNGQSVSFDIASYDKRHDLVIDPVISYGTFLDNNRSNLWYIATDNQGNAYGMGLTFGFGGPPLNFVNKYNPNGGLVYTTAILNETGSFFVTASTRDIKVDPKGSIYVSGFTSSPNFPVTPGAFQTQLKGTFDGFLVKFSPEGDKIVYATYLGGSDDDFVTGLAVNDRGLAYVHGITRSVDFPAKKRHKFSSRLPFSDNYFVAKFNTNGTKLAFSNYVNVDFVNAIDVDKQGSLYVVGRISSDLKDNFPIKKAFQPKFGGGGADGFVTKFDAEGELVYSTFLGGDIGEESSADIAVNNAGSAYILSRSSAQNFPSTKPAKVCESLSVPEPITNLYVTRLNAAGDGLRYSTCVTSGDFENNYIGVDSEGSAYVSTNISVFGEPNPAILQLINPIPSTIDKAGQTANTILTKLNPQGDVNFLTFLNAANPSNMTGITALSTINMATNKNKCGEVYLTGKALGDDIANPINPVNDDSLHSFVMKVKGC